MQTLKIHAGDGPSPEKSKENIEIYKHLESYERDGIAGGASV